MIDVDATKYNRTKAAVISKFKRLLPPAQARDTTRESRCVYYGLRPASQI